MNSAVLFLVFNRPETTSKVFEEIRSAKPPRLYVAADGPRPHRDSEAARCEVVRQIATAIDWPCELKTLFRDENMGCRDGVAGAIDWFFENELEGIILEDDVLPIPGFFSFCDELLEKYRETASVAMISGCNLVSTHYQTDDSYFFSRYNKIWGWASWRRSWVNYDKNMRDWPKWKAGGGLERMSRGNKRFQKYWSQVFDLTYKGGVDTWDYQWTFACWKNDCLTVLPRYSQVSNLGFGDDATHTNVAAPDYIVKSAPRALPVPLRHPTIIERSARADALTEELVLQLKPFRRVRGIVKKIVGKICSF